MKTKYFICAFAVAALLVGAGVARAETLYSCDFENPYTSGNLVGQDNWVNAGFSGWQDPLIASGPGINSSQVFIGNTGVHPDPSKQSTSGGNRLFTSPLIFDRTDTAVEFRFWANTEDGGMAEAKRGNLAATMMWDCLGTNKHWMALGMYFKNRTSTANPMTFYRDGKGVIRYGDALTAGHWYEIKAVMDFSALCDDGATYGKLTYEYRDVTAEETGFTTDGTFQDMDMYLALDGNNQFKSNGILAYVAAYNGYIQHQYIDNFSVEINPVPEPSTLALLASGLIGLLCYAWRKRK